MMRFIITHCNPHSLRRRPGQLHKLRPDEVPVAVVLSFAHEVRLHLPARRQVHRVPVRYVPPDLIHDAAAVRKHRAIAPDALPEHHGGVRQTAPVVAAPAGARHRRRRIRRERLAPLVRPAAARAQRRRVVERLVPVLLPPDDGLDRAVDRGYRLAQPQPRSLRVLARARRERERVFHHDRRLLAVARRQAPRAGAVAPELDAIPAARRVVARRRGRHVVERHASLNRALDRARVRFAAHRG
mmetsp:Transcript_7102/g.26120  ORF Transcript_7102/g.26120 Transcript_7102/m.26120 type:complete len:242 (-) Transcript_7102:402-1127(-)